MEERDSSFVELRTSRSSHPSRHEAPSTPLLQPPAPARMVSRALSRRQSLLRRSSTLEPYTDKDANQMILEANAPPQYEGGFDDIMKEIKRKRFFNDQFQRIQMQTEMGSSLYFSNEEPTYYETNFLNLMQETSVNRVRICCFIGFMSLAMFYTYEWNTDMWEVNPKIGRSESDVMVIKILTFGVILGSFLLTFLLTFLNFGKRNLENITVVMFSIVAIVMIAKKPIEKAKGPVIPLLILLIPIFGITRMRFIKSCCIGWGIFATYFITMTASRAFGNIVNFDDYTNISYQSINYGLTVIGGMVSQYRQELLRRRNFCLQLPFSGAIDSDSFNELKAEKFSKRTLMHRWSQSFRNPEVEETFYRYWYLIDPFPYENPNSGSLHAGVFRTIRFAIRTLFLNQVVLLLQDVKFLRVNPDKYVDQWGDFTSAIVLRFGVVVPLYLSSAMFMFYVGKAFYERWVREADEARNQALNRDIEIDIRESEVRNEHVPKLKLIAKAAQIREHSRDRVLDVINSKGGYVRATQIFTSVVIACHVLCMGILLLIVSTGPTADKIAAESPGEKVGKPKPVYYMGFLNAVLFAHRSGLRVRFIYATYTTCVVAVGIVAAAGFLSPEYYLEYAGYVFVIFIMGMMISYEEENLRRTFFVLKSIRTLEFEEWFEVVLKIQGWVKERFRKKLEEVRAKRGEVRVSEAPKKHKHHASPPLVNTSAQMAQASKFGMYSQAANIIIALVDVLTTT